MNNNMMQQNNLSRVSISELTSKMKSKKELYNFLLQDCQAYLPPMHSTNVYFLKQIMKAEKEVRFQTPSTVTVQYIKRDKVIVAAVPQIEGLTVEDMLELAKRHPNTMKHLPDARDWDHMDRKWLSDVMNTVDRQRFEKMVKDAAKDRKARLEEKRNLVVEMRPEFEQAFKNSMRFSSKALIVD